MRLPPGRRSPAVDTEAEVGLLSLDGDGGFEPLATTTAWCWQQGARVQWLPGSEGSLFVHNAPGGAQVRGLPGGKVEGLLPRPIYAADPCGSGFLTLDFGRLHRLRKGYGYASVAESHPHEAKPAGDGVWWVEAGGAKARLLVSMLELAQFDPLESMEGAEHYVNHLSFSPSGQWIAALHMWTRPRVGRFSRTVVMRRDGLGLRTLNREGMASHYTWTQGDELLQFARHPEAGDRYIRYTLDPVGCELVLPELLREDGHPSELPAGGRFVTDTYPDPCGDQRLLICDPEQGMLREVGRFYSAPEWAGEVRCDLHPRLGPAGQSCIVDVSAAGRRGVMVVPLPSTGFEVQVDPRPMNPAARVRGGDGGVQ
ncbi:MAG: hypothetical protein WEA09_03960 [Gemmatimonadota bacterium]